MQILKKNNQKKQQKQQKHTHKKKKHTQKKKQKKKKNNKFLHTTYVEGILIKKGENMLWRKTLWLFIRGMSNKCVNKQQYVFIEKWWKYQIQWNLGNSNANFSKLPDFSKTTDGPEFFHYNLLQKYHRFF